MYRFAPELMNGALAPNLCVLQVFYYGSQLRHALYATASPTEPKTRAISRSWNSQNHFVLAFCLHSVKTMAGRRKKVAALVGS